MVPARPSPPVFRCLARTPVLGNSGPGARLIAAHKARTRHTQRARRARDLAMSLFYVNPTLTQGAGSYNA
jgi:hypothetical protein